MRTLFISDLHLESERPDILRAFLTFLEQQAKTADQLYILGDFFEVWVGDDDQSPLIEQVTTALRTLSDGGTQLFLMHGNRDFLIGEQFVQTVGATLLDDPAVIELNGQRTLLMHGDTLCTEDRDYLQFRAMVRNPEWQQQLLSQPLEARHALARQLRDKSMQAAQQKELEIMDVTTAEVQRVMEAHNTPLLIHGHTHRPNRHKLEISGSPAERIVLGDWDKRGWVLEACDGELELKSFDIPV